MGKKFDVEKFVADFEAEEAMEEESDARYAECPRCGSDVWDELIYGKSGKVVKCSDCKFDSEQ